VTQVEINGSQCSDRDRVKPWSLFGGQEGGNGGTLIRKAGSEKWLTVCELYGKVSSSNYVNVKLQPGDRIRLTAPCGGGYGDPREREPALVEEDVREGYVSRESAARLPLDAERWLLNCAQAVPAIVSHDGVEQFTSCRPLAR
jgi:5-oxoprolinase (ATP-hydrolysing)/N-methylhydantoinase B